MVQVSEESAKAYACERGLMFAEVSAKSGEGVSELFKHVATILPRSGGPAAPQRQPGTINVSSAGSGSGAGGRNAREGQGVSQCCGT